MVKISECHHTLNQCITNVEKMLLFNMWLKLLTQEWALVLSHRTKIRFIPALLGILKIFVKNRELIYDSSRQCITGVTQGVSWIA